MICWVSPLSLFEGKLDHHSTGFEPDQYQISVQMYGKITTEAVYNIMTA